MPRHTRLAQASLLALAAASCAAPPPAVNVEGDWRKSLGNLGVFALYPIAEDVQPGDVYIYAPSDDDGRFDLTLITGLPRATLVSELAAQQAQRLRFQRETPAKATEKPPAALPERHDVGNAENDAAVVRVRRIAMPGFTAARLTQAQVGGGLTTGNVGLAAGFGASDSVAVTVTLSNVEELAVDAARALRMEWAHSADLLYRDLRPEMLFDHVRNARATMLPALCRADFPALADARLGFVVANRVLYAHGIDYNFHQEASFAAAVTAAVAATQAAAAVPKTPPAGDPAKPAAEPKPGDQAAANAAALLHAATALAAQQKAMEGLVPSSPGISARVGVGRLGVTALSVSYARPMAIGIGAPRTLPLEEVLKAQARIARGVGPLTDVDAQGGMSQEDATLIRQYAALRLPMRRSFENLANICRESFGANAADGLASLISVTPDTTPVAGPVRVLSGPSVRDLMRGKTR